MGVDYTSETKLEAESLGDMGGASGYEHMVAGDGGRPGGGRCGMDESKGKMSGFSPSVAMETVLLVSECVMLASSVMSGWVW